MMDTTHTENLTLRSLYVFVLVLLLHNTLSQTQWFKAVPIYYLLTPVVRSLDTMQLNAQGLTRLKSNQDAIELCSHVELIQGLGSSSKLTQTISRIHFLDAVGMKSLFFFLLDIGQGLLLDSRMRPQTLTSWSLPQEEHNMAISFFKARMRISLTSKLSDLFHL